MNSKKHGNKEAKKPKKVAPTVSVAAAVVAVPSLPNAARARPSKR
jgi:hypothetical protein